MFLLSGCSLSLATLFLPVRLWHRLGLCLIHNIFGWSGLSLELRASFAIEDVKHKTSHTQNAFANWTVKSTMIDR
ncbi:hypothetical protein LXL04_004678 [Taraxacum kok-saghyz]